MCLKTPFASKLEARERTAALSRKRVSVKFYYCSKCQAWHFSVHDKRMQKHKREKYPFNFKREL